MTATEELRRLLDERGVKYRDYFHANKTWWGGRENVGWYAEDRPSANGLYVMIEAVLTPEQAIAATLGGPSTCRNVHEPPKGTTFWPLPHFKCSECGATHVSMEYVYYCPKCGAKVVDDD